MVVQLVVLCWCVAVPALAHVVDSLLSDRPGLEGRYSRQARATPTFRLIKLLVHNHVTLTNTIQIQYIVLKIMHQKKTYIKSISLIEHSLFS